jgi:hypothetical protein
MRRDYCRAPFNRRPANSTNKPKRTSSTQYRLGKHITLNNNVPNEIGCAEAVSYVLEHAGIANLPTAGYAGTADLYRSLLANPQFMLIEQPEQGAIIVSPTGFGNGPMLQPKNRTGRNGTKPDRPGPKVLRKVPRSAMVRTCL